MPNDKPAGLTHKTRITLVVVLVAIAALALSYFAWFGLINDLEPARVRPSAWGEFGDFVGGIANPLVALFALYWLTESIRIQRQELAETRLILSAQSEIDKKRNFESTFFALLGHLSSMHDRLKEQTGEVSNLAYLHESVFRHESAGDANEALEDLNSICGHYFISLFQTLKFVASHFQKDLRNADELVTKLERSSPSQEEKFYSNIVRASLDSRTTQLLAINGFSSANQSSYWLFKVLVERYSMLEHMPFSVRSTTNYHSGLLSCWTDFYQARAFGRSDYVAKLRELGYAP